MFFIRLILVLIALVAPLHARDLDGRYANSPLRSWFQQLHSGRGPCCSFADGQTIADVDWRSRDGHYQVFIEQQWVDVPDDAVIREPNLAGRTIAWPYYAWKVNEPPEVQIRCFIVGPQT